MELIRLLFNKYKYDKIIEEIIVEVFLIPALESIQYF